MGFFKSGLDLSKVAKAFDGLNLTLKELIPRIEQAYNHSPFKEEICVLAFIARRDIINLMEENNWSMEKKIMVSTFNLRSITLASAYFQTVDQIELIASNLGFLDIVQEILKKGEAFYVVEKQVTQYLNK